MKIIAVCGGSGSGKSHFSKILAKKLPGDTSILPLDSYYRDLSSLTPENRSKINFDTPDSIEYDLIIEHVEKLKSGVNIECPTYSFVTQTRQSLTKTILPSSYLIVEGILVFCNEDLRRLFDLSIFLDIDRETRLQRIVKRDLKERDRTEEETINRFYKNVEPMFEKHIEPHMPNADITLKTSQPTKALISNILNRFV